MIPADTAGWGGHPRGLSTLFFIEMWERFSYYGMRAFLILYMVAPLASGGLGFSDKDAASIYGTYTGSVWGMAILGGIVADRFLGQFKAVLVGGSVIALGHFTLAFKTLPSFYVGLVLIVIGTGLLKPNASTLVGSLYEPGDRAPRRGLLDLLHGDQHRRVPGPIIAGYLAQRVDWHAGFAAAGVGMAIGLVQYWFGRDRLAPGLARIAAEKPANRANAAATGSAPLTADDWKRVGAIVVFFIFATIFWGAYEQAGSTLNLFADRYTRLSIAGFSFPSSWFQSVQPIFVILLAPVFAWLWVRLGDREPSSPAKLAIGLFFAALAFLVLVPAGAAAQASAGVRVSPWWLIVAYFITELGELCVSPVGLSLVTKLSPVRIVGLMMGVWFLSNSFGNKLAGWAAGFFSSTPLPTLFGTVAGVTLGASILLFLLIRPVRALMGPIR